MLYTFSAAICASDRQVLPVSAPPAQRSGVPFSVAVAGLKVAFHATTLLIRPSATPSSASQLASTVSSSTVRFAWSR
ncbi:hypothetical protein OKW41_003370 [Paraburkholderia sp. UCT70]